MAVDYIKPVGVVDKFDEMAIDILEAIQILIEAKIDERSTFADRLVARSEAALLLAGALRTVANQA